MAAQADINRDYKRLKVLLEATDNAVITFVLYRDAKEQRANAQKLKSLIDLPVTEVALKGDHLNPVWTFLDLPKDPRQAIFYTFLGSSLPEGKSEFDKFAGYVNIQREAFEDAPHAVVLWLREEQLVRLMRRAPDFWAWRSGVFDFRGELELDGFTDWFFGFVDVTERGQLEERVALYREILKGQLERDEPDLAYVARTRSRLANLLRKLGFYAESIEEEQQVIEFAETIDDQMMLANALRALASVYEEVGRYGEAESAYRRILKISEETSQEGNLYAARLSSFANFLGGIGRYAEAEHLYREIMRMHQEVLGEEGRTYSMTLNNFANVLSKMGRYNEAEPLFRKAVDIGARTFGREHTLYALNLSNLATLLSATGRFDEAEELYNEAIAINAERHGKEHLGYAAELHNLAELLRATGRYAEATPLFQEALAIFENSLEEGHPSTRLIAKNYELNLQELENQKTSTS